MSVPLPTPLPTPLSAPLPSYREALALRALPDYEPDAEGGPPARWSSLRPRRGPQLSLVAPPPPAPVSTEALGRLFTRVLEVLDGRRQVGQLRTLLPDAAYEALLTRLRMVGPGSRHVLRRLRVCHPAVGVVEVSAVVEVRSASGRTRVIAAAARFERVEATWRCAVLRFL